MATRETPSQYGSELAMSSEMTDDEMIPKEVFFCIPRTNIDTFSGFSGFSSTHSTQWSSNSTLSQIFSEKRQDGTHRCFCKRSCAVSLTFRVSDQNTRVSMWPDKHVDCVPYRRQLPIRRNIICGSCQRTLLPACSALVLVDDVT